MRGRPPRRSRRRRRGQEARDRLGRGCGRPSAPGRVRSPPTFGRLGPGRPPAGGRA
jgi:hypothetical protein